MAAPSAYVWCCCDVCGRCSNSCYLKPLLLYDVYGCLHVPYHMQPGKLAMGICIFYSIFYFFCLVLFLFSIRFISKHCPFVIFLVSTLQYIPLSNILIPLSFQYIYIENHLPLIISLFGITLRSLPILCKQCFPHSIIFTFPAIDFYSSMVLLALCQQWIVL